MTDFVYTKAPLIEVILELHWSLKSLGSAPNAAIDPYYDLFRETFLEKSKNDLPFVEELVPSEVPIEFISDQPHLRLRPNQSGWPLIQIGPGIMTVNIVPPYNGWSEFRRFISTALDLLFSSYPVAEKTLAPNRVHLRYIDALGEQYGMDRYTDFVSSHLCAPMPVSPEILDGVVADPKTITYAIDSRFKVKSPEDSTARIRISPGKTRGRDAVILEFHCDAGLKGGFQSKDVLMAWYDQAHEMLHTLFDKTVSSDVKKNFGDSVEVSE